MSEFGLDPQAQKLVTAPHSGQDATSKWEVLLSGGGEYLKNSRPEPISGTAK